MPRLTFAARTSAVALATLGLTIGAAGVASATTATNNVSDNTVSVTFKLEAGEVGDSCVALLAPTASAAAIAAKLSTIDLGTISDVLSGDAGVTVLKTSGIPLAVPVALVNPSVTLSATGVPSNVYSLVTYCLSDGKPNITPAVLVGNPVEAISGSASTLSASDTLAAGSSLLGSGTTN